MFSPALLCRVTQYINCHKDTLQQQQGAVGGGGGFVKPSGGLARFQLMNYGFDPVKAGRMEE